MTRRRGSDTVTETTGGCVAGSTSEAMEGVMGELVEGGGVSELIDGGDVSELTEGGGVSELTEEDGLMEARVDWMISFSWSRLKESKTKLSGEEVSVQEISFRSLGSEQWNATLLWISRSLKPVLGWEIAAPRTKRMLLRSHEKSARLKWEWKPAESPTERVKEQAREATSL